MNLNQLVLPPGLVAELYRTNLVLPAQELPKLGDEKAGTGTNLIKKDLEFPVNRHRNTLLLVRPGDTQEEFLNGILTACNLRLEDVALVEINETGHNDYKKLVSDFKCRQVILFGIDPSVIQLPLSFPHFQLQSFAGINFLFTPRQTEMKEDKLMKSKLWVSLRRMFGI